MGPRKGGARKPALPIIDRELAINRLLYPEADTVAAQRPRTRADCVDGPRPCPWAGCRYHLHVRVTNVGGIQLEAGRDPLELVNSCGLDLGDYAQSRGGLSLREVGDALVCTRERVRQIEARALHKLQRALGRQHPDMGGLDWWGEEPDGPDGPEEI